MTPTRQDGVGDVLGRQGHTAPAGRPNPGKVKARRRETNSDDFLADRTPTTTDTPIRPTDPNEENAVQGGYWVAAIVAILGLTAAFVWGAVGTITALDRVDSSTARRSPVPGPCR